MTPLGMGRAEGVKEGISEAVVLREGVREWWLRRRWLLAG